MQPSAAQSLPRRMWVACSPRRPVPAAFAFGRLLGLVTRLGQLGTRAGGLGGRGRGVGVAWALGGLEFGWAGWRLGRPGFVLDLLGLAGLTPTPKPTPTPSESMFWFGQDAGRGNKVAAAGCRLLLCSIQTHRGWQERTASGQQARKA